MRSANCYLALMMPVVVVMTLLSLMVLAGVLVRVVATRACGTGKHVSRQSAHYRTDDLLP